MPFAEEFLIAASREIESKSVAPDFEHARGYIIKALEKCMEVEPWIKLENIDIFIHGSYANKSNIYFPSNLEIVVEITTARKFSPEEVLLENNYFVDVPIVFGPREFRKLLTDALYDFVGDKLSEHPKTLRLSGLEKIKHDVDITPCVNFHFYQDGGVIRNRGVLLYDTSVARNIVSFPRLHAQNGFDKDASTAGNFKRMVRLFKTLHSLNVNEFSFTSSDTASGYFVECLLYNVPDKMFIDSSIRTRQGIARKDQEDGTEKSGEVPQRQSLNEIFFKVINYLLNADMDDFVCQNTVWTLFGSAAEFWDKPRAEAFLGSVIRLHSIFPPSRTFLA